MLNLMVQTPPSPSRISTLNSLWHDLGKKVVIKDGGLEQPCRRHWGGHLSTTSDRGHDALICFFTNGERSRTGGFDGSWKDFAVQRAVSNKCIYRLLTVMNSYLKTASELFYSLAANNLTKQLKQTKQKRKQTPSVYTSILKKICRRVLQ